MLGSVKKVDIKTGPFKNWDFHGVNSGRYTLSDTIYIMFLDILEFRTENQKNILGKTVLKMWSQICGGKCVHKTTIRKKCKN